VTNAPRDPTSLQPLGAPSPGDRSGGNDLDAVALLGDPNRRRLYELVVANGELGRDRAAEELGMSRELAAFHLDRMVRAGLLEASYRRISGRSGPGAGRPAKLYRRSAGDRSVSLPPRRYDAMAGLFAGGIGALAATLGSGTVLDAVARSARAVGRQAGLAMRLEAGAGAGRGAVLEALKSLLARAGYEPRLDRDRGRIDLCNCPYRALSAADRDLTCGANLAWAEGLLEGVSVDGLTAEFKSEPGRCCVTLAGVGRG
jgi:predicted ArsR family transcriptional regulator